MAPAATPPSPNSGHDATVQTPAFGALIHTALQERAREAADPSANVASGVLDPQALCRYAAGRLEGDARERLQGVLVEQPWAVSRVTALVKGARTAGTLAARILTAAEAGPVDPYRTVAAALVADLGQAEESLESPPVDAAPLVRAASLLARGQRADAEAAFAAEDDLPPLARAARRLASLDDQDEALAHLLDAV